MIVGLSRSFSPFENPALNNVSDEFYNNVIVENALVTVQYLAQIDTLSMISSGVYTSDLTLSYNYGDYTLHVKDKIGNQEISAISTMLPKVLFDTVSPVILNNVITINYSLTDNNKELRNWYVISYYNKALSGNINMDINNFFDRGTNEFQDMQLISDLDFTNNKYFGTMQLDVSPEDTIAVVLSNISEGYFKFLQLYQKTNGVTGQISGEPVTYPTNVKNGYGYFNTHNPDIAIFDLNNY
jgi:hypothetical protein